MARVLIEVPTFDGRISPATSESLWRLDRAGHEVDYRPRAGYGVAMARNRIAADALDAKYDWVMMVDSDISLPADALAKLISHDVDICMGWYLNRYALGKRRKACLFKQGSIGWDMWTSDELKALADEGTSLVRVAAGGMGCCLFRTKVFDTMPFPWFEWTDLSRLPRMAGDVYGLHASAFNSGGEDVNFCINAASCGFTVWADTRVACGHEFREVVWP